MCVSRWRARGDGAAVDELERIGELEERFLEDVARGTANVVIVMYLNHYLIEVLDNVFDLGWGGWSVKWVGIR